MKRFVNGITEEFFFQKRVPKTAPEWIETATVKFPSGRSATELVANDAAHLVWAVNLGVIDAPLSVMDTQPEQISVKIELAKK